MAVATNSYDPVFEADWLSPGCHLGAIVPGEVDPAAYRRADVTVVNSKAPFGNERGYLGPDETDWSRHPDLGELVAGAAAGRASDEQITFFMNNAGLGHQFAACGAAILSAARARGLGHEVPADWLLQPVSAWPPASSEKSADGAG